MASKFNQYAMADRRLAYQPVVAQDKSDGYSADEVNHRMMEIEQEFETYLRRVERQLLDTREALATRQEELAKLANLADQRADASNSALAGMSAEVAARDNEIGQLKIQVEQQATAAQIDREATAVTEAQMRNQITNLEQAMAEIRQSLSWRLTRPVRWIASLRGNR